MPTVQPSPVPPPLNQHSQDPCVAHIAVGQARAEAPANSLIKVDVDADTNPRDLDPDKLNLYDSFDTNDVFHCQREHHYEPQERARILALDQAIMRQCSTIEVELLYVDQRWLHPRKAPPGRKICRHRTFQAAPGPRSRSPVKRVRGMPNFLMVIKTVPPDTRPSKEPPGIVSCPSIEMCRHQTDFHYGYQNVSQDPNFLVAIRIEHKAK
ncbi:hypothetical protein B0H17DRAFT_1150796 [Mycena rosella]|uniref:Uncharacterized protein n=1 Tax=Mycena rosella TaxID=1033263 RepID=A0AAD7BQL3_MYCRO|nr:hypothetical protein B0H17DRAFT_1150796 [Mycena rosella]